MKASRRQFIGSAAAVAAAFPAGNMDAEICPHGEICYYEFGPRGDKGKLLTEGWAGQQRLLPYEKTAACKKPPKTLPRSKGRHRDWIDACKGGPAASSNFQYGAKLTELVLLGVLALRLGKRIAWAPVQLKVPGVPEADALINEPRRKGWEIV